jgi:fido (protein-threonine AMPylation protein)
MSDPYIEPQSGILRNKFGLTDKESLDRAEANVVSARSILLQLNPLKGNFDSEHLKAIHSCLFRDVYEWAGQFRTIPLAKAEDVRGGRIVRFTPPDLIERELNLLDEITDTERIQSLAKVIAHLERGQFKWNDVYLATTTSGQSYAALSPVATEPTFSFAMTKAGSSSEILKI